MDLGTLCMLAVHVFGNSDVCISVGIGARHFLVCFISTPLEPEVRTCVLTPCYTVLGRASRSWSHYRVIAGALLLQSQAISNRDDSDEPIRIIG